MAIRDLDIRRLVIYSLGLCLAAIGVTSARTAAFAAFDPHDLELSAERVSFSASQDGSTPPTSLFTMIDVINTGATSLNWTIAPSNSWIFAEPWQGSLDPGATTSVAIGVDVTKASVGPQSGTVTIWDADAVQSLRSVTVFLRICERTCVFVDAAAPGRTISPLLFGSQFDWLNSGSYLWNRPISPTCDNPALPYGVPSQGIMEIVRPLGLRLLRYPAGISADFFNWSEAVGPVATRRPQINPYAAPGTLECPVVGPDEANSVAIDLGAQLLTVANVGTGTAEGAAAWLTYDLQQGVRRQYWEIGNEVYLPGSPIGDPNGTPYAFAGAFKFPEQYAAAFDEYARALRAVDPSVKVGAVLSPDASAWNDTALAGIQEPIDFVSTHLLFPKFTCTLFASNDQAFRALMAAPALFTYQLDQLKQTLARSAVGQNKNADIGITEHGSFFWCLDYFRNRTLASGLFSALSFHVFLRDPRVVMATSSNLTHPLFQSLVTPTIFGTALPSAASDVFRAYAQTAGGIMTATTVLGSPTFSSEALGDLPRQTNVPVLDTVAVLGPEADTLRLFVVNRSLTDDAIARVAFDGLGGTIDSISVALVNGASYASMNTIFTPKGVTTTTYPAPPAGEFDMTFPAHSLVVFAVRTVQ